MPQKSTVRTCSIAAGLFVFLRIFHTFVRSNDMAEADRKGYMS